MAKIDYRDLQYHAESHYFRRLQRLLVNLRKKYEEFHKHERAKEAEFHHLLAHSLKIGDAPQIQEVIDGVRRRLGLDFRVHLFVSAFPVAQAMCTLRYARDKGHGNEPILIVSQHFLNDLEPEEQSCIIGHELAHVLFGHASIPAKVILEFPFRLGDAGELKAHVLKWMICSEISCDLVGLVAGGRNAGAFVHGLLKFTTGLHHTSLAFLGKETVNSLVQKQFAELTESKQPSSLSTHPLTLLRATILECAGQSWVVEHFGDSVDKKDLEERKLSLNRSIDELVARLYPEVPIYPNVPIDSACTGEIRLDMSIAVALADGSLDASELDALIKTSPDKRDALQTLSRIKFDLRSEGPQAVVQKLVKRSVSAAKSAKLTPAQVMAIIRHLLLIAASDGDIKPVEVKVISDFGQRFGVDVNGLERMISSLGLT